MSDTCDGNCGSCKPAFTRHPSQPQGGEPALYGGVWVKPWTMPEAAMIVPQHSHQYPHLSYLAAGAVRVIQDGEAVQEYTAPAAIRIPAKVKHTFEILEAGTLILCIHNAALGEADFHEEGLIHEKHELVEA